MTNDVLKLIPGQVAYSVTRDGKVWSHRRDRWLKLRSDKDGYNVCSLPKGKKRIPVSVHRVVAMTYIQNPEGLETVNHIDGDKTNNNVENLEWMTRSENARLSYEQGLQKGAKLTKEDIKVIREMLKTSTQTAIAKMYGCDPSTICNVNRGRNWSHIW